MSILDWIIGVMAPYECLACGTEGDLLCPACLSLFPDIPERCYRCRRLSPDNLTCAGCRATSRLRAVRAVTVYEGIAQQLVWQLKFAGARQAARQIAQCIAPRLRDVAVEGSLIVPVPTSSSHVRQRGFDQAKLIARAAATQAGVHYVDGLIRAGQTRQVGASRQLRLTQLHKAFRVRKQACGMMQDAHVVLIDDVVTTGATLEAAAAALVDAGARRIDAVVFAQPERV